MKIGFIGVGIMGKPMAKNLIKAGYNLVIFDINKEPVKELVGLGAEEGFSPKDVAERTDVIITMLPDSPQVKEVILGEDGVLEGAKKGSLIIDMSSINPSVSREIAKKAEEKGIDFLDAPVSGGEPKAIDGTLSIMVGGKKEVLDRCYDILSKMGTSITLCGDVGTGNITKLANQIIVALNIAAMSEALVLATKAGVDPEVVYKAIRGGLAGSVVLDAKVPKILARDFTPGFKIDLHIKDLNNAMATAREFGTPLFLTSQVIEILQSLKIDGKELSDHSAIVQFYEKLVKIEVKKKD